MRNTNMKTKSLLLGIAVLGLTAMSGCELYFDDRDGDGPNGGYTYCDETGCWYCDDYGCYPEGTDGDWGSCYSNYDCAAGCYCDSSGACVEAGFCGSDADCPEGFICDDRASCVPEGSDGACESDADCPYGSYCDEASGTCVGSWTCTSDEECGPGFECDDRGTCVPSPCTSDDDCLEGCSCNEETGVCEESGTCTSDDECGEGMVCDTDRATCVPCDEETCPSDPGNCYETVLCDEERPSCPLGTVAGVRDGCYTGSCIPTALCPDDPPWECADASNETECIDAGCFPVYVGINCTNPSGGSCTGEEPDCTCESFEYGLCRDTP
jgi:hypothetical protein